jgi:diguanylate cyclase (GGDEF)-like protein/PAS domain S-box-containing protein
MRDERSMSGFAELDLFRNILENLHIAIYFVNREGRILFWNDGAERITGYLRQEVIGRLCQGNFLGELDDVDGEPREAISPIIAAARDGMTLHTEISLRHKSGYRVPVHLRTFPVRNLQGAIVGAAESFEESISVGDWDRRHTKLAQYGCIDQASGALNQGMMNSHLREHLAMFAEHPIPFSVLYIHIDDLKKIQLRDGPAAVASVMRVVGQTLENSLRPTDYLGRWGENQFLAILVDCNGMEVARAADRLRRMVGASKIAWWGDRLPISVSVGATAVSRGDTVESMVRRAEEALGVSISEGGNRSTVNNE